MLVTLTLAAVSEFFPGLSSVCVARSISVIVSGFQPQLGTSFLRRVC